MTSTDLVVRVLKDLAGRDNPRVDVAITAQRFNLTASRIKEMVAKYGWPNPASMARAAAVLEGKIEHPAVVQDPREFEVFNRKTREPVAVPAPATITPEVADHRSLRLSDLVPHPSNPVDRTEDVAELADSIKQVGLLQPLVVTEHPNQRGWLILAGHRRHAALKRLGRTHADCVVRPGSGGDLDQQLFVMLIENVHRKDLTAMEKAYAFGDLRDRRKMGIDQIAARAGLSRSTVSYYLSLLDLDATTQAKVQTGEIPITVAINAVKNVRASDRRAAGAKPVGHPVVLEPAWFTRRHPLAAAVKEACTHTTRPKVGAAGCGQCWEDAIRQDATATVEVAS